LLKRRPFSSSPSSILPASRKKSRPEIELCTTSYHEYVPHGRYHTIP
jgi:hypothetical protein